MEERPLECSNCKRKATVFYKEMINGEVHAFKCCKDCPLLKTKFGEPSNNATFIKEPSKNSKCPECHTTKETFMQEQLVGCEKCYEVFEKEITDHLETLNHLPQKVSDQTTIPLHLGKVPEHTLGSDIQKKLESLELALTDALSIENYERAAFLRDEIKGLQNKAHGKERKAS